MGQLSSISTLSVINSFAQDSTEPTQGDFTFTAGDELVAEAQKNGQLVRGHNCVWYNQLPSWVSSGNFNASELTSIVQIHCSTLVGHYKGDMYVPPITLSC